MRNKTPYQLGQSLLPGLRGELEFLSLALSPPTTPDHDTSSWHESFLDGLMEIDDLVERIDTSIVAIRIDHKPWKSHRGYHQNMSYLNASYIASVICQVKDLLETELLQIFIAYDTFC
ncbi:hypothetical protein PGT21_028486 [Puccinia graminis f. sp. tritici]|uniref:Uncharacterized protein n=1 Tax=Puccinia graminis f. sp. tritici TaxID=56615 RepID=A0A5B0PHE6_PUCGR|nr:hypothetical protein PGT21_028486 [Puccinia graminis f. sp. tritici]KAA1128131.1 hypothetical protein PGTUg99_014037 [Puccinia graminis f. sp. tritici]